MRLKGLTLFLQISQSLWIFYPSLSRHRSEYPGFISPIPLQLSHSLSPDLDACIAFYETFCGMRVIHRRPGKGSQIVWMAEPGQEQRFIFVIMPGGQPRNLASDDYSHFGFALSSRAAVDDLARRAEAAGCLVWAPRDEPYPVGYYCGLRDPAGNYVEFSYGQPLGPGSEALPIP